MSGHNNEIHILSYEFIGKILVILLGLTFLTVFVTEFELGSLNLPIALLIASTKVYFVLTYFMHLKWEPLVFRVLVIAVWGLLVVTLIITFFDYAFR